MLRTLGSKVCCVQWKLSTESLNVSGLVADEMEDPVIMLDEEEERRDNQTSSNTSDKVDNSCLDSNRMLVSLESLVNRAECAEVCIPANHYTTP